MEETKRDRQRQKEKNNVKNKNHSVRKHRMKCWDLFPALLLRN